MRVVRLFHSRRLRAAASVAGGGGALALGVLLVRHFAEAGWPFDQANVSASSSRGCCSWGVRVQGCGLAAALQRRDAADGDVARRGRWRRVGDGARASGAVRLGRARRGRAPVSGSEVWPGWCADLALPARPDRQRSARAVRRRHGRRWRADRVVRVGFDRRSGGAGACRSFVALLPRLSCIVAALRFQFGRSAADHAASPRRKQRRRGGSSLVSWVLPRRALFVFWTRSRSATRCSRAMSSSALPRLRPRFRSHPQARRAGRRGNGDPRVRRRTASQAIAFAIAAQAHDRARRRGRRSRSTTARRLRRALALPRGRLRRPQLLRHASVCSPSRGASAGSRRRTRTHAPPPARASRPGRRRRPRRRTARANRPTGRDASFCSSSGSRGSHGARELRQPDELAERRQNFGSSAPTVRKRPSAVG